LATIRSPKPGEPYRRAIGFRLARLTDVSMIFTIVLFFASAGAIYLACEFFVNGVEWLGRRLNLTATATGTVLAAFGTALPESAVTFVAVVLGRTAQDRDLGVGAAVGGPLVLSTIAYGVVGMALLANRRHLPRAASRVPIDQRRLSRDQGWFLAIFACTVVLGLVSFALKPWLAFVFVLAYGFYVRQELRGGATAPEEEELEPLKLRPRTAEPSLAWTLAQTVGALVVIAFASRVFVSQLEHLGTAFGMAPHIVALLLSPVATELPETLNALIWVRQGKERLALANISGAMMIQATIPSALGVYFTPWRFDGPLLAAGVVSIVAVIALWTLFRRGAMTGRALACVGLLYLVFAAYVIGHFH
jgi:cation:H+ antiporter